MAPATTTPGTSSPQWYVPFALQGVGVFGILPPAVLDVFSLTVAELGQRFTSHPHTSDSGLKKEELNQKPLSKALYQSPSPALPGLRGTCVNHKTLPSPESWTFFTFQLSWQSMLRSHRQVLGFPSPGLVSSLCALGTCHLWLKVELNLPGQLKFGSVALWSTLQLAQHVVDIILGCAS